MAAEILIVDHETVGLSAQLISVDARTFVLLAQSESPDELARAAELWRGEFLPDLALDIEEFETWHRQEANRLSSAAGVVFEALYRYAVASGDGDRAIAEAERLVALDPAREDRQRNALKLLARHKGREAAMGRAKQLVDHLRVELGVVPEAATRALIDSIKRGDFEPAMAPAHEQPAAQGAGQLASTPNTAAPPPINVADAPICQNLRSPSHRRPAIRCRQAFPFGGTRRTPR
ncbi:MAG: bacterial transcriptional activator domain-containing protein [Xanthobacteraceae bacterium]